MPKLNDTQRVLLATAGQRYSASLYPLPDTVKPGARLTDALKNLTTFGFAEERETTDPTEVHRTEGDMRYGLYATATGLAAVGMGDPVAKPPAPATAAAPRETKTGTVLALLQRDTGATLADLIDATGWLPHTTRAALTGLRKKGHAIERGKRGDDSCYFVKSAG